MIRVLIADDLAENRYLLETLLKGNGYEVVTACNGAEALELARKAPPDVVITDILMPVMDGFSLCRQWKADERLKPIPFIFYTATYTDPKDEEFALSLGAERFIVKPKKPEEMIALVHEILNDAVGGRLASGDRPSDKDFLRDYNETLFRKLEKKVGQLEQSNAALQQEIDARKKMEKELVYRNTLLATQQDTSLDGILVVDAEGKMVSYNRRFVELWGIPHDVVDSRSDERALRSILDKIVEPERFLEKVRYLYEHREQTSRELVTLKDHRVFDRYSSAILGEDGHYYGRVWYFRDITEQKKLEEQLRLAQKMEAIGTLAGGVAHDFNNIMTAIMGYACILQKKLGPENAVGHNIDQILSATKKAAGLTKSLLTFSKKQTACLQPVNINDIIQGFQRMMTGLIRDNVQFTVACAPEALILEADAGQMEQVLMNLTVNALDAMPRGGVLTVTTNTFSIQADQDEIRRGSYAVIAVSDSGIGMDKGTVEHIFEPFFTTKGADKGTGLGLAVVYGIIKNHKGFIRVYSELGKGTIFKIYLPLTTQALRDSLSDEKVVLPSGTETILLAEDDANVRMVTCHQLQEFGYTVLEATDGEDAVAIFHRNADTVRLVICDLIMPRKNGKETLEAIRKEKPDIKVIFTSGYTKDVIARKSLMEEDANFLSKPVSMLEMIRKVREVLDT